MKSLHAKNMSVLVHLRTQFYQNKVEGLRAPFKVQTYSYCINSDLMRMSAKKFQKCICLFQ